MARLSSPEGLFSNCDDVRVVDLGGVRFLCLIHFLHLSVFWLRYSCRVVGWLFSERISVDRYSMRLFLGRGLSRRS
jgi:hypothetical protein